MGTPGKAIGGTWFRFVLLSLSLSAAVYAQSDTAWLFRYPGAGTGRYQPLASFVDDTGNVYVAGWTGEWGDNLGVFLVKVDSLGRLAWARTYDNVEAMGAARDTSGNTYIAGGEEGGRVCLLKYGPDGTMEWLATYGGAGNYHLALSAVAIDDSQNVYVGGVSGSAVRVLKYRPDGTSAGMMSGTLRNDFTLVDNRLCILDNGDVYLVTNKEHPSGGYSWSYDWLVARLSREGRVMWERIVNEATDRYRRLRWSQVDGKGNVYLTGEVVSALSGSRDFCTMKMDSAGNTLWVKKYDGPEKPDDVPYFLRVDRGNVLVSGWSIYRARGENRAITLVKYDSLGNQLWASQYGKPEASYHPLILAGSSFRTTAP